MGIFTSFKEAIFGKSEPDKAAAHPTPVHPATVPGTTAAAPAPAVQPVSEVDVEAKLDGLSGADALNWRTSIVDLMKLIGIDASYANRKELAQEMGRSDYSGSAEDNIWLHKRVMSELAKAGGKVPASMRD